MTRNRPVVGDFHHSFEVMGSDVTVISCLGKSRHTIVGKAITEGEGVWPLERVRFQGTGSPGVWVVWTCIFVCV